MTEESQIAKREEPHATYTRRKQLRVVSPTFTIHAEFLLIGENKIGEFYRGQEAFHRSLHVVIPEGVERLKSLGAHKER